MKVISLFDGISTGQYCLKELGINVETYYASEIEESAIAITQYNYPNTIQLGDVNNWKEWDIDWSSIDLLIGGSPCTDLSIIRVGQQSEREGLKGSKSGLFYRYVEILNHLKSANPNIKFLLENNHGMPESDKNIITELMGVEPIMLDAADFSAQRRKRLFWTNIPNDGQPNEKSTELLKDIVEPEENVPNKYWYKYDYEYHGEDANPICTLKINCFKMGKRVSNLNSKCYTLTCVNGGYTHKKVRQGDRNRKMMPIEYERCQSLPDNYTKYGLKDGKTIDISDGNRYNACGNGWNANVIKYLFNGLK